MPQASNLYQSPLLSQIAVDFKNKDYIADQILTPVNVPKMLGQYLVWDSGVTFKLPKTEMAQNGVANMLELAASKSSFTLVTHALQAVIDELERDQAPEAQIEAMKVAKIQNALLLQREIDVAAQLRNPAVITQTTDLSGTGQWSDYAASDPIRAILAKADTLPTRPNVFLAGRDVISALRTHPKILTAIQYTQMGGIAPLNALADLFEVDKILVGDAFKDTAGEGLAASKSLVWQETGNGGMALLAYVDPSPPSPIMDSPTLGYLPTLAGGGVPAARMYKWVDQNAGTGGGVTRIKGENAYGVLVSAPTMAYLWTSVLV
jgi:hypothetical protein